MSFTKKKLALRNQLIGANYFHALAAFEFAEKLHTGYRKDKVTPEFQHQIEIALHALTLPNLMFREEVISAIMLHDVREDFDVSDGEIRDIFWNSTQFQERVAGAVERVTKKFRGTSKDLAVMFEEMSRCPIASIVKGCDRVNNVNTMVGVFGIDKQKQYCGEVRELFLPMLKVARRNFPHQVNAYESIKFTLNTQLNLISAIHQAMDGKERKPDE